MSQALIHWNLKEIMFRHDISGVALANELNLSGNAVSHLRRSGKMPRLDGDSLNSLVNALNKLSGGKVGFEDLLCYTPDEEANNAAN